MRKSIILVLTMAVSFAGAWLPASADVTAEDAAKYRQHIMKALSGHIGAVSMITRGIAGDPANLAKHTAALVDLAAETGPAFEAGGGAPVEDSEALPAIWEQPDKFASAVERFAAAAAELDGAAGSGDMDAVGAALRDVGASCKGCHEDFRLDD